jgi:hypothetical protein
MQDLFSQLANNATENIPLDSTEVLNQFYSDAEALNFNVSGSAPTFTTSTNYSTNIAGEMPTSYWRLAESSGGIAYDSNQGYFSIYPRISSSAMIGITQNATSFLAHSHAAQFTSFTASQITFPNNSSLQITGDLSVEFWVKFTNFNTSGGLYSLIVKEANTGGSTGEFEVYLFNNSGVGQVGFAQNGLSAVAYGSLSLNNWYHVVIARDGSAKTVKVYINGSLAGSTTYTTVPSATTNNVTIGNYGVFQTCQMFMTEVALYQKPLTATQASTHYNWGIAADALAEAYNGNATLYGTTPYPAYTAPTVVNYSGSTGLWGTFTWK